VAAPGRTGHYYVDETCIGCGACVPAVPARSDAIEQVPDDFMGRVVIELEEVHRLRSLCSYVPGRCDPRCPDATESSRDSGGYMKIKDLQAWAKGRG